MNKAIELLEKAIKGLENYSEPPVIRTGPHPLKAVYENMKQVLTLLKQQPPAGEFTKENMEIVCAEVHKAYCNERINQGKEPYWTGGDYNKLDEPTKEYDRATVRAILKHLDKLSKK